MKPVWYFDLLTNVIYSKYSQQGNQLTITDQYGVLACTPDQAGVYQLKRTNQNLIFTLVSDACDSRKTFLALGTYRLNSPVPHAPNPVELSLSFKTAGHGWSASISIAVDKAGNVFVTDNNNNTIQKYNWFGQFVTKWGSKGSDPGQFEFLPPNPQAGPRAGFLTLDSEDNVYVSDTYNNRVQKFDNSGTYLSSFGSPGNGNGQFPAPGPGPLSFDHKGNLYVAAFGLIQKFTKTGVYLSNIVSPQSVPGQFLAPNQPAFDKADNLYIGDLFSGALLKFNSAGTFVSRWRQPQGLGNGKLLQPLSLVIDSQDNLFVTDNTNRVQKFTLNGTFLGKWDKPAPHRPQFGAGAVALDAHDNIYVTTYGYQPSDGTIYKFNQE